MYLKFDFRKNGSASGIVTVSVDENGDIQSFSCTNSDIERQLKRDANHASFQDLVKCTVNGTICSDQLEIKANGRCVTYKVEQMP